MQDLAFGITGINRASPAFQSVRNDAMATANALKLTGFQTQNLSFQMQDLGQGLLTGQSPFRLIIQQGSQIAQIFNPGTGLAAALKATGASLLQFLTNPLNLAVLGFAAAGAAAGSLFSLINRSEKDIKPLLEEHKRLIDEIGERYGDAALTAGQFGERSRAALETALFTEQQKLRAELSSALGGLGGGPVGPAELFHGFESNRIAGFGAASTAVARFLDQLRDGKPDVISFREELNRLARLDPTNAPLLAFINEYLAKTEDANRLTIALRENASGLAALFQSGATPLTGSRQQAERESMEALFRELGFGGGFVPGDVIDAKPDRAAERAAKRIQDVIASLQFEAEQLTRTNREQSVYNALKRAGVEIDSSFGQQIATLAASLYDQRLALDQNIESLDRMRGVGESILDSFSDSLRQGMSVWDAFAQAGLRALDQIIDRSLELASIGLFGTPGTAETGILGTALGALLPGFAHGGAFTVGGPGGTDRSLVAFRATRGERVRVSPSGGGGDGGEITVRILADASPLLMQEVDVRSTRNAVSVVKESNRQMARHRLTHE